MSSQWASLPNEIVKEVFLKLWRWELSSVQHVCRTWRRVAQGILYQDINVRTDGARHEQQLIRVLTDSYCEAQYYVKKLTIDEYNEVNDINYTLLTHICTMCPNITSINIGKPSQQFYQMIYQLRELGHLSKIHTITKPWPKNCIEEYCKAILLMKAAATEIYIYSDPTITMPESGSVLEAFPVAQHLKEFPCLEKVVITTATYMTLSQFDELLDMCPKNKLKIVHLILQNVEAGQQQRRSSAADKQTNTKPQHILTCVKELLIENDALLTNQDLEYVMEKFPALEKLNTALDASGDFSDTESYSFIRSIQSTDTVLGFINYLWRISHCIFYGLRITPETMIQVILQTSQRETINNMEIKTTHADDPQFTSFGLSRWEPKAAKRERVSFSIPPLMETIYQQALEAFSSQVEALDLTGSADYAERDVSMRHLDEGELAESRAMVNSLEYALTNFKCLKKLRLSITTLPSTFFNDEPTKTVRLDSLNLEFCSLNGQTMHALSKRLEFVEEFLLERNSWENDLYLGEDIYMPQTAFGTIVLIQELNFDYMVQVSTESTTVHIDFQHGDYRQTPKRMTEEQYNKVKYRLYEDMKYYSEIDCASWSTIEFNELKFHNEQYNVN